MKTFIIGAGKTGRGFIARLCEQSGIKVNFVDNNSELVRKLNNAPKYSVGFFGDADKKIEIDGFRAYSWENADFSEAELIFVSVGGQNLENVGNELHKKLSGKNCVIITCENASNPAEKLKKAIDLPGIRVSESTVFCTTVENEGLDILSEPYPYLQCNKELLGGYVPQIKAIKPVDNFSQFLTRKLYTYNAASCVIAYLGALKGYVDYAEAANDTDIQKILDQNYSQTNYAMCKKFGYDEDDQKEFAQLSKNKFCSKTIRDTVERNGRDPLRKLGDNERIIGPMKLIYSYGTLPVPLIKTAAAALLFKLDKGFSEYMKENSVESVLTGLCGLERDGELFNEIIKYVNFPNTII